MLKSLLALLSLLAATALAESGVRRLDSVMGVERKELESFRDFLTKREFAFSPHAYTGYVASKPKTPAPSRPRDWKFELPSSPEVLRIACLGGSTTYEGYPEWLELQLEKAIAKPVMVMNWGVLGWTSLESMINYFINVQDYEPDIVILHHAINDAAPRRTPGFRSDYSHWRRPWNGPEHGALASYLFQKSDLCAAAALKWGHPGTHIRDYVGGDQQQYGKILADLPAGSEKVFERNMRTIAEHVTSKGGKVVFLTMGYDTRRVDRVPPLTAAILEQNNEIARRLCAENGYLLVDGELAAKSDPEGYSECFADFVHMNEKGKERKARLVADALLAAGYVTAGREPARGN